MEIKITEVNGWSKLMGIKKAITRIGSSPSSDIQLPSNLIAPLHLQILSTPDLPTGCRVVNLANQLEIKRNKTTNILASYSTQDVSDGDEIQLGEFTLTFCVPFSAAQVRTSSYIQASLTFVDTTLQPYLGLDGLLTVKNVGDQDACQFQVSLSGLPEDCFHIDPIPLLYPGAQEDVHVRLFHKITYPQAGRLEILFTVNAPADYPGEELVIRQSIFVAPVFKQAMEIVDDIALSPVPEVQVDQHLVNQKADEPETPQPELQIDVESVAVPMPVEDATPENEQPQPQIAEQVIVTPNPVEEPILHGRQELPPVEKQEINIASSIEQSDPDDRQSQIEEQIATASLPVEELASKTQQAQAQLETRDVNVQLPTEEPAAESWQAQPPIEVQEEIIPTPVEEPVVNNLQVQPPPVTPLNPPQPVLTVRHDAHKEIWADEAQHEEPETPATHDLNLSKVKVVRTHTETYWDES